jgi:hypothetical protein
LSDESDDLTAERARRSLLRHCLATLAYRGGKAIRGVPDGFAKFRAAEGSRSAGEILAHVGDLLDWAASILEGHQHWQDSGVRGWTAESDRFFAGLARLDALLASDDPLAATVEKIFQGPIADALTHTGQIAMLRRLAGSPVRGENYFAAAIEVGRVGPDQAPPKREFG